MKVILIFFSLMAVLNGFSQTPYVVKTTKLADSIYLFEPSTSAKNVVDGNAIAIIAQDGVILIDAMQRKQFVDTMLQQIRKLTALPVTIILNTHWHNDHTTGIYLVKKMFPKAKLYLQTDNAIAFERNLLPTLKTLAEGDTAFLNLLKRDLVDGTKFGGAKFSNSYERVRWEETLRDEERLANDYKNIDLKLFKPDFIFGDSIRINVGNYWIDFIHILSSHSPSDVQVWIPAKKILITGDIVVWPIPYAFNSKPENWKKNLEKIVALGPLQIVPGHGPVEIDLEYINYLLDMLFVLDVETRKAFKPGITFNEFRKLIKLDSFKKKLSGSDEEKIYAFDNYFLAPILRTYFNQLTLSSGK